MTTITNISNADRLEKLWQSLQAIQQLQDDRIIFGLDHVDIYVEDVGGDWLDLWGEEERVNLRQWLENIFEVGWQTVESLLGGEEDNLALVFRTAGIKRGKYIDLGIRLDGRDVALVVTIKPEESETIGILLQVHSITDDTYLPDNLQLRLLGNDGNILYEVTARNADNVIQIEFEGEQGEEFSVQVALGDFCVKEDFLI